MFGEGPKTRWEYDLERLGRNALIYIVRCLIFTHCLLNDRVDHKDLLMLMTEAKKHGRLADSVARIRRYNADPDREVEAYYRRQKSAKAAARRRKAAARKAAKGTN